MNATAIALFEDAFNADIDALLERWASKVAKLLANADNYVAARDFVGVMRADVARLRASRDERRATRGGGSGGGGSVDALPQTSSAVAAEVGSGGDAGALRFKMDFKTGKPVLDNGGGAPTLARKPNGKDAVSGSGGDGGDDDDDDDGEAQTLRAREAKLATYVLALEKMRSHLDKTMAAVVDKRFAAFDHVYFRLLEFQHTAAAEAATLATRLRPSILAFRAHTPLAPHKPPRADTPIRIDGDDGRGDGRDDDDGGGGGGGSGRLAKTETRRKFALDDDDDAGDGDDDGDDDDGGDGNDGDGVRTTATAASGASDGKLSKPVRYFRRRRH